MFVRRSPLLAASCRSVVLCRTLAASAKPTVPTLEVILRSAKKTGSRRSRELREEKFVPGVIYGSDGDRNVLKMLITVKENDLNRELRLKGMSFENTIYELVVKKEIEGAAPLATPVAAKVEQPVAVQQPVVDDEENPRPLYKEKVLKVKKNVKPEIPTEEVTRVLVTPRQTQFNPVTDKPVSVNFLRYRPGNRVRIPVEFINEDASLDMRRGCYLVRINNFVECECDDEVPAKFVVDLAEAKKGDVVRVSNIQLPPKVRPSKRVPLDFVLAVVQIAKS